MKISKNGYNGGGRGGRRWEIFTRNGGGGGARNGGLVRGVLTLLFYEDLLYCLPPFQILSTPSPTSLSPPTPTPPIALSVVMFLWLNGWSRHIWCAILLNYNMDLYMSSLGTLVPEGPGCVFHATKHQVYRSLTQNVVFHWYSDLISNTNTHNTLRGQ